MDLPRATSVGNPGDSAALDECLRPTICSIGNMVGFGQDGTATLADVAQRFRALRKQYKATQRRRAAAKLAETAAQLKAYTAHRSATWAANLPPPPPIPKLIDLQKPGTQPPPPPQQQQQLSQGQAGPGASATGGGPAATPAGRPSSGARPSQPGPGQGAALTQRQQPTTTLVHGQAVKAHPILMPREEPAPRYTQWTYLKRNELARDHGRRMFLVDAEGETVPADEGEVNLERLPWDTINGGSTDWAMTRLAGELGWDSEVLAEGLLVALRLDPAMVEAVNQRLAKLRALHGEPRPEEDVDVEETINAFAALWCRRCRTFACPSHGGGHVRPHHRAAPLLPPAGVAPPPPCGPGCWRHQVSARGNPPAAAGTSAAEEAQCDRMEVDGAEAAVAAAAAGRAAVPGAFAPQAGGRGGPGRAGGGPGGGEGPGRTAVAGGGGGGGGEVRMTTKLVSMVELLSKVFPPGPASGSTVGDACNIAVVVGAAHPCAHIKAVLDHLQAQGRHNTTRTIHAGNSEAGATAAVGAALPSRTQSDAGTAAAAAADEGASGSEAYQEAEGAGAAAAGAAGTGAAAAAAFGPDLSRLRLVPGRRKAGRMKKALLAHNRNCLAVATRKKMQEAAGREGQEVLYREYFPCTCEGKCRPDCPCVAAGTFCEKFCACSPSCGERFRGCVCRAGCRTKSCPCLAAGRECDPDLCAGCAATAEGGAHPGRECHNMRLRLRQHAHMVLGTSDIPGAGWGLFSAQYVPKHGFLGEYTGDLITQDEANRRGSVYDKMNNSYLFNLNQQWVLDAKFRGNKLRCANHSSDPVARAKTLTVDGESRIAIFALKDVKPGMEITYDYKYGEDVAPEWVKKKQRAAAAAGSGEGA